MISWLHGEGKEPHISFSFIHSHVIKISWIYSSACLYLETFQHHERWHKQIMELPLCTARRQNRPREKTISLEINCALCLGIHCSVPHKAEGKEMKSYPPHPGLLARFTGPERSCAHVGGTESSSGAQLVVGWAPGPGWDLQGPTGF